MTNLMDEVSVKACSKCGEVKTFSKFSRNPARKDKLHTICKVCCNLYSKNHTDIHKKRRKERLKKEFVCLTAWKKSNSETVLLRQKAKEKKDVIELKPVYVAKLLKMKVSQLTPELEALKREQMTMRRMAREMKKAIESTNQKEIVK